MAVGILALMMTLTSEVMTLTMEATGRAKAITEVNQLIRIFEQTIRDDLRAIDPQRSVMVIQGNPINAYWTQNGQEGDDNGDPVDGYSHPLDPQREDPRDPGVLDRPRADILMFFTTRKEVTNYVPYKYDATVPPDLARGVSSNVQQVVYGHAEMGEYVPAGPSAYDFVPGLNAFPEFKYRKDEAISPIPAERWHLARRSVVLTPITLPIGAASPPWADYGGAYGMGDNLADPQILLGATDVMGTFDYEEAVLTPQTSDAEKPRYLPVIFGPENYRIRPFERSQLDPTPPPIYSSRLGHYFMPHCASFKVEWAIDPNSEVVGRRLDGEKQLYWIDQGNQGPGKQVSELADPDDDDPLLMLQEALDDAVVSGKLDDREDNLRELLTHGLGGQSPRYSLRDRFGGDVFWKEPDLGANPPEQRHNLAIFTPKRANDSGAEIPDNMFPVALRITVDLFDNERRLERPIRHVMIIPVGG